LDATPRGEGSTWFDAIAHASQNIARLADGAMTTFQASTPWSLEPAFDYLRSERFEDALKVLNELPKESRKDPDAELLRAAILTNSGRVAEAEIICSAVLARDGLNAGAHYVAALCHEHSGNTNSAKEFDEIAIYLDPHFAMPHLHLGLLAKKSGDPDSAKRELGRAIGLLATEDAARILLFGGGFSRDALMQLCRGELRSLGSNYA
jgi:chemotaxis protein methyltransferase CheR